MPDNPSSEIAPELFRKVMGRFVTGVTVITVETGGEIRGMTANAFMSGSMTPPLCVISVGKSARMHEALTHAAHFGVSILAEGQEAVSSHFAGHGPDLKIEFHSEGDVPVLAEASATIAAKTLARHDCGDHTLFIGQIHHMRDHGRPPLVYHGGHFGSLAVREEIAPEIDFW